MGTALRRNGMGSTVLAADRAGWIGAEYTELP